MNSSQVWCEIIDIDFLAFYLKKKEKKNLMWGLEIETVIVLRLNVVFYKGMIPLREA
jgi:hypothetical protein